MNSYWALYSAQMVSLTGSVLNSVVAMFWIYGITGSITKSVWGFAASALVCAGVSSVAAAVVDRGRKKEWVLAGELVRSFVFLAFYFMAGTGSGSIWVIYGLQALLGISSSFSSPAISAWQLSFLGSSYKRILPLTRSIATAVSLVLVAAGGVLSQYVPFQSIFLYSAATYLAAFFIEVFVGEAASSPAPAPSARGAGDYARGLIRDIKGSFAYMAADGGGFLKIIFLFMVVNSVFAPIASLLPMVVKVGFSGTPAMYSMILLANGSGALVAGLLMSRRPVRDICRHVGLVVLFNGVISCATFFVSDFRIFTLMVFLVGMGLGSVNIGITLLISAAKPGYYCKVRTHSENIAGLFVPFGLVLLSALAERQSVMLPFLVSGVIVLISGGIYLARLNSRPARLPEPGFCGI